MTLFEDIPPFFEPSSPPPALPNLLAQTEIGRIYSPPRLLAQEELGTGGIRRSQNYHVCFSLYTTSLRHRTPPRSRTPRSSAQQTFSPFEDADMNDSGSKLLSDSGLSAGEDKHGPMVEDDQNLIPQPVGEAGRPGRGGYNLEKMLGWPKKDYQHVKSYMKQLIEEHLKSSKSFQFHSVGALANVQVLACEKFPILRNYASCWPVMDFIRLDLKYTSQCARLRTNEKLAKVGKATVEKAKAKVSE